MYNIIEIYFSLNGGSQMEAQTILKVENLETTFFTDSGEIPAVNNVSFHVKEGEVLGIVGESGSGKSVTSLSIMGLVPSPPGKVTDGKIHLYDKNLLTLSDKQMRKIRGNDIAMIFQEPMTSLNPLFTIGNQMLEAVLIHKDMSKQVAKEQCIDMLRTVGLPRAEEIMNEYPHQLSGGMRQRVMIAMALICNPKLLIADEPTTALDVTTQAQILKLMKRLNDEFNTAIMLITHDLGVVAEICERVIVMYAGQVVEEATVEELFRNPQHPYTKGLIASVPDIRKKTERLYSIRGNVPIPGSVKQGCQFASRCEAKFGRCTEESPPIYETAENKKVRCFLFDEEGVNDHDKTAVKS